MQKRASRVVAGPGFRPLLSCAAASCTCLKFTQRCGSQHVCSCRTGLGMVSGTAWSFTDIVLGFILASSNQLAGKLTDITVGQSLGNVGCFWGGGTAAVAAIVLLLIFTRFGSLGQVAESGPQVS